MLKTEIWTCKIGEVSPNKVPYPGDPIMRQAVQEAYMRLTGEVPKFTFSGWGGELTEGERELVDSDA